MIFRKIIIYTLASTILGLCLFCTIWTSIITYLYVPINNLDKTPHIVRIKPKTNTKNISRILAENHIIINYPYLFEYICKLIFLVDHKFLKSGEYQFTGQSYPMQVIFKMINGLSVIHKFVIPEGCTVSEAIQMLENNELLTGSITSTVQEGHLFPSTYFYSYGDQREVIINQSKKEMTRIIDKAMLLLKDDSAIKDRHELLTLASIIEKESGRNEEKPIIASVFLNRLKMNMKLQADPTTIYAVTQGKYKLNRSLTKADLRMESPYNTYFVRGLPAGPIACPGEKSIYAVVSPAQSKALYFVTDGQGKHKFADTLQEHNVNVQEYRKKLLQQQADIKSTSTKTSE
jgi:UPF0755 protein